MRRSDVVTGTLASLSLYALIVGLCVLGASAIGQELSRSLHVAADVLGKAGAH